jgi:hypothetical protein
LEELCVRCVETGFDLFVLFHGWLVSWLGWLVPLWYSYRSRDLFHVDIGVLGRASHHEGRRHRLSELLGPHGRHPYPLVPLLRRVKVDYLRPHSAAGVVAVAPEGRLVAPDGLVFHKPSLLGPLCPDTVRASRRAAAPRSLPLCGPPRRARPQRGPYRRSLGSRPAWSCRPVRSAPRPRL